MKNIQVLSDRLMIKPKTLEEMKRVYQHEQDEELKQAYLEMIEEMIRIEPNEEWGTDWSLYLKTGEIIGGVGFKGMPDKDGIVEIGYEIDVNYRNQGYATEAVNAMLKWAFMQSKVTCVQAQIEPKNDISKKVLLKNKFQEIGIKEEGPLFEIKNV